MEWGAILSPPRGAGRFLDCAPFCAPLRAIEGDPHSFLPLLLLLFFRRNAASIRLLNAIAADSRTPIAWVYAAERGSGVWHVHVLLTSVPEAILEHQVRSWCFRNGIAKVTPVFDTEGAVTYLTKDAALDGEIVLSDTMTGYKDKLMNEIVVELTK